MLRSNVFLFSFAALSTAVLLGLARRGAASMPRGGRRAGSPLYRPPTKPRSADRAAIEPPFLWVLSFAQPLESIQRKGGSIAARSALLGFVGGR
jgi:hypothetical protein